jgi:hypothetical protein
MKVIRDSSVHKRESKITELTYKNVSSNSSYRSSAYRIVPPPPPYSSDRGFQSRKEH